MASPQIENGHIDIANEIGEHLARFRISGEEHQILWVIWRKTYGWHKTADCISLSQFFLATGMKKPSIVRAIKNLEGKNMISKSANRIAYSYRFNKDFETWRPLAKKLIISKNANKSLAKLLPTIENYTKENFLSDSHEVRLSGLLLSLIRQRNPNFKQPNLQRWASHIDKMFRRDKRSVEDIEKVVRWCQADPFWQNNVLSTAKLREQFDKLFMKMTAGGNGHPVPGQIRYY